jgi:exopolysaccharide production protein ExoZ
MEPNKLQGLQAGRALAALSVAYFHSYMLLNGWPQDYVFPIPGLREHGYLGVNFFFAISGFVISSVCDKPEFSPRPFLIKRVFRVYPVYLAVILLTIVLKLAGVAMPGVLYNFPHVAYSLTLLPQDGQPFYPVTWSLEYEVMFYLLAVLVVPFLGVWGLAAVLLGLVRWSITSPPDFFTLHLVSTINADFLAGVLAYLLRKPLSFIPPLLLIGAGLFGYYCVAVEQVSFSGSAGGFLLVSGLINARWRWDHAPLRWLAKLGDASYSLYLLHFILIWIAVALFERTRLPPAWTAEPLRFAYAAVCIWLSVQTYRLIERPMIRLGNQIVATRGPERLPVQNPASVGETRRGVAAFSTYKEV